MAGPYSRWCLHALTRRATPFSWQRAAGTMQADLRDVERMVRSVPAWRSRAAPDPSAGGRHLRPTSSSPSSSSRRARAAERVRRADAALEAPRCSASPRPTGRRPPSRAADARDRAAGVRGAARRRHADHRATSAAATSTTAPFVDRLDQVRRHAPPLPLRAGRWPSRSRSTGSSSGTRGTPRRRASSPRRATSGSTR